MTKNNKKRLELALFELLYCFQKEVCLKRAIQLKMGSLLPFFEEAHILEDGRKYRRIGLKGNNCSDELCNKINELINLFIDCPLCNKPTEKLPGLTEQENVCLECCKEKLTESYAFKIEEVKK